MQTVLSLENAQGFLELVFYALEDEETQVKKTGLVLISNLFALRAARPQLEQLLPKHKMQIFKLALPRQKQNDVGLMTKALGLLRKILTAEPDCLSADFLQLLKNLVHYPAQAVKEEAGELILSLSAEFDAALMELQRLHPTKDNFEEFNLNFNDEPQKSQKQLLKLVRVFQREVQTRSHYLQELNDTEAHKEDLTSDSEEKAALLFLTFHKRTSVLYDVQSMRTLLLKDDVEYAAKEVIASLMYLGVKTCLSLKDAKEALIFKKMWESAAAFLQLPILNELL